MLEKLSIPSPGLGTYRLEGEALQHAICSALDLGYRHIDTAQIYDNEADVGSAMSVSKIKRKEIFITTKVWIDNLVKENFVSSVKESLQRLQTDYLDLLLIHWPSPKDKVAMQDYLTSLNSCMHKGFTRSVGVSNFTAPQLEQAFSILGKENVEVNQIEVHPHFQNRDLVSFCQRNQVQVVAYMPLGKGKVLEDETLIKLGKKYNVSAASISLAWLIQQNIVPIPASTNAEHQKVNLEARDIRLLPEEMDDINKLDTNERLIDPEFAPDW